jgi:hypothetical protein
MRGSIPFQVAAGQSMPSTVHAAGVAPLSVGGDHSISLPILRAIAKGGPLGLVHVDALIVTPTISRLAVPYRGHCFVGQKRVDRSNRGSLGPAHHGTFGAARV